MSDPEELVQIKLWVCRLCLESQGSECHTPGCAFWLHDVPKPDTAQALSTAVSDSSECEVCLDDTVDGQAMCVPCRAWKEHWDSLTPEGRRAELQMMAAHASVCDEP